MNAYLIIYLLYNDINIKKITKRLDKNDSLAYNFNKNIYNTFFVFI